MTIIYGIFVDEFNLKAIAYLEQYGISAPTQVQIDEAEHYLKKSRVSHHTSVMKRTLVRKFIASSSI